MKNDLSVVVITFNEETNIGRCLDSVSRVADEIVVLDSFSTDKTVEIARQKGAIVKQQKFVGHIEQKNDALSIASNHYILSLDADEALDETLIRSILQAKSEFAYPAYTMNRCANYCGKFIHHGGWYPDRKLRLFDKRVAHWGGINPHDKIEVKPGSTIKHLPGDILHYTYGSIEEHISQSNKLTTISALSWYKRGKKTNRFNIVIRPIWVFLHSYIVKAGFLDGLFGFIIAVNVAHSTFLKHAKLFRLLKTKGTN